MSDATASIELLDLCKTYGSSDKQVVALSNISISFKRGEFVAVMGPSGSGKSTLLHILGCLDIPTSGAYTLESIQIQHLTSDQLAEIRNRRIGFVFQTFQLLPRLTALQNVALPMVYAGLSFAEQHDKALQMLEKVGLAHRAGHTPSQLSGGEQQRVALARALVNSPALILADEPTGNLDSQTSQEMMALLIKTCHEFGVTVILVTHDPHVARLSERIIRLKDGRSQD